MLNILLVLWTKEVYVCIYTNIYSPIFVVQNSSWAVTLCLDFGVLVDNSFPSQEKQD